MSSGTEPGPRPDSLDVALFGETAVADEGCGYADEGHWANRRYTPLPARTEHRRQLPPGAARGSHENNRGQGLAVTRPPPPSTLGAVHFRGRNHTAKQLSQLIRHQPLNQICHDPFTERLRHKKRRLKERFAWEVMPPLPIA